MNYSNGSGEFPLFFTLKNSLDDNLKTYYDTYDVFVNGDYIGHKVLAAENEKPSDINSHLEQHGFYNFKDDIEGNQISIEIEDNDEAKRIKRDLKIFLNTR